MQSETGHQLKSYVASKSHLKLAARAVLSADAGLLVSDDDDILSGTPPSWGLNVRAISKYSDFGPIEGYMWDGKRRKIKGKLVRVNH